MVLSEAKNPFTSKEKLLLRALKFSIITVSSLVKLALFSLISALISLAIFESCAVRSLVNFESCAISILATFFLLIHKNNHMVTIPMNRETFSGTNVGATSKKEAERVRNGMSSKMLIKGKMDMIG